MPRLAKIEQAEHTRPYVSIARASVTQIEPTYAASQRLELRGNQEKEKKIMSKTITLTLSPKQAADVGYYTAEAARKMGVREDNIALVRVLRRSIDARRKPVKVKLHLSRL